MEFFTAEMSLWFGRAGAAGLGGAAGYLYYRLVGCKTGACPITGNPWISTIYGAFIAGMIFWK